MTLLAKKRAFYDKYGEEKLKEGYFTEGELKGGYQFKGDAFEIFEQFFGTHNIFSALLGKIAYPQEVNFQRRKKTTSARYSDSVSELRISSKATNQRIYTSQWSALLMSFTVDVLKIFHTPN